MKNKIKVAKNYKSSKCNKCERIRYMDMDKTTCDVCLKRKEDK